MRRTLLTALLAAATALICALPAHAQQARGTARSSSSAGPASGTPLHATRPALPATGAAGSATGRVHGARPYHPHGGGAYWPRQTPLGIVMGTDRQLLPFGRQHTVIVAATPAAPLGYAPVAPYGATPRPDAAPPRETCALVSVLQPGNRGYWKELRLPAAGAQNTDELLRILEARVEEGAAFRVRDAAGEWLDIPAAAQLERIVVERCA